MPQLSPAGVFVFLLGSLCSAVLPLLCLRVCRWVTILLSSFIGPGDDWSRPIMCCILSFPLKLMVGGWSTFSLARRLWKDCLGRDFVKISESCSHRECVEHPRHQQPHAPEHSDIQSQNVLSGYVRLDWLWDELRRGCHRVESQALAEWSSYH